MSITDPVSGRAALLLLQTDITVRAELEARMAALTESQLAMLEQMFPRCGGHQCLDTTCACTSRQLSVDVVHARLSVRTPLFVHVCTSLFARAFALASVCACVWSAPPPSKIQRIPLLQRFLLLDHHMRQCSAS